MKMILEWLLKRLFNRLLASHDKAREVRKQPEVVIAPPPAPVALPSAYNSDPYGEEYGCNSIFGMG